MDQCEYRSTGYHYLHRQQWRRVKEFHLFSRLPIILGEAERRFEILVFSSLEPILLEWAALSKAVSINMKVDLWFLARRFMVWRKEKDIRSISWQRFLHLPSLLSSPISGAMKALMMIPNLFKWQDAGAILAQSPQFTLSSWDATDTGENESQRASHSENQDESVKKEQALRKSKTEADKVLHSIPRDDQHRNGCARSTALGSRVARIVRGWCDRGKKKAIVISSFLGCCVCVFGFGGWSGVILNSGSLDAKLLSFEFISRWNMLHFVPNSYLVLMNRQRSKLLCYYIPITGRHTKSRFSFLFFFFFWKSNNHQIVDERVPVPQSICTIR